MSQRDLPIDGIDCGTCVRRVTQSVQVVAGALAEQLRTGASPVKLSDEASTEALIAGLSIAGCSTQVER